MKTLFAPAAVVIRRLSVYGSLTCVIGLFALAQLGTVWVALANWDARTSATTLILSGALIAFILAIYLFAALSRTNKKGMEHFSHVLEHISSGNLTEGTKRRKIAENDHSEAGRMWRAVAQMSANLVEIVNQVRASASHIGNGSREISAGYSDLSQRTEEQASTLEETAASMEELSATVKQNAEACREANQSASETGKRTEEVGHSMQLVSITMDRIEGGSKKMSEIIGLIEGIAFQTNILALNAAVEAARAGEQGRGFSVVAAEVRSLAQKSAQAAEEIKGLIETSNKDVSEGAMLVSEAHKAVDRAVASMRTVMEKIESIATASEQQNAGVQEIGKAIAQLENVTQQNAALVEEGAAAASAFESEAGRLVEVVGAFKLDRKEEREKAVELVKRGIAHMRAVGPEQALQDFHDPKGAFVEGEHYIYAFNSDGVLRASPFRPDLLGVNQSDHVDHDGKKYVQEILRIAKTMGKGWHDYRSTNPVTRRPEAKSAYIEREGDFILGCGIYSDGKSGDSSTTSPQPKAPTTKGPRLAVAR